MLILKYFICEVDFVYNKHLSQSSLSRILRSFLIETLSGDLTCLLRSVISTMLLKFYSTLLLKRCSTWLLKCYFTCVI